LSWPVPAELTDVALEEQLFTAVSKKQGHRRLAELDWAAVHRELKRKHVALQSCRYCGTNTLSGGRAAAASPAFASCTAPGASWLSVTMRQSHTGGDKLFVDYAGDTVPVIVNRLSGKTRPAQIFVAVLGASNFTYAQASWTQALADWIGAHIQALEAVGSVPQLLVPDTTKVAVIKACLYEPLSTVQLSGSRSTMHDALRRRYWP
jgi:transposase